MIDFIFQKNIEEIVRDVCKSNAYSFEYSRVKIETDEFDLKIGSSSFAYIVSENIDIPVTAKVTISSPNNFISFSKKEFDTDKICEYENFMSRLQIKTENYGDRFIPFQLKLLVVTPYIASDESRNKAN